MRALSLLILAAGVLALSACNTTIGMSRDLRAFGAGVENVAHGRHFDGGAHAETPPDAPPPAEP
jgi:predicted small secreted protein